MSHKDYDESLENLELVFVDHSFELENIKETVTATFAFVKDETGKLIVMKNERGWDIPGGHIEEDDDNVISATHREVKEEICATIQNLELFMYVRNKDTAMTIFVADLEELLPFVADKDDPTSDRSAMSINEFRQVYGGGSKELMSEILDKLQGIE